MMLLWFVGLTAMDVSLCGVFSSQDVLTFAAFDVAVEHSGVPISASGLLPNAALVTGAGASTPLCVMSIGWVRSPPSPAPAAPVARNATASRADVAAASGMAHRRR